MKSEFLQLAPPECKPRMADLSDFGLRGMNHTFNVFHRPFHFGKKNNEGEQGASACHSIHARTITSFMFCLHRNTSAPLPIRVRSSDLIYRLFIIPSYASLVQGRSVNESTPNLSKVRPISPRFVPMRIVDLILSSPH